MTPRERILAVYRGETPDAVPFMLDLSHWFYHSRRLPWDLTVAYEEPERGLIDYHRRVGAGFYLPNLAAFFATSYGDNVVASARKRDAGGRPAIVWRLETPLGAIERERVWEPATYAWGVSRWGVASEPDLRILAYALARRTYTPKWENYRAWRDYVGDLGVIYLPLGYSAMGHLLHYWMGVERTLYAAADWPRTMHEVIDAINANLLDLVDLAAHSPAEVIFMGDNFSSDVQPPHFFAAWSRPFYVEAVRRLHAAGKYVAVHIDGKLRGALGMVAACGADCADAVTPRPLGDLTAAECRDEAGREFILSGGVSPDLWLPTADLGAFERAVRDWLDLRRRSPCLIAGAGDQVPPNAAEDRIEWMRELVEEHGRY